MSEHRIFHLKNLISSFHGETSDSFEKYLPLSYKEEYLQVPNTNSSKEDFLLSAEQQVEMIHYSWLHSPFEKMSTAARQACIGVLSEQQKKGLLRSFDLGDYPKVLSKWGKKYLRYFLLKELKDKFDLAIPAFQPSKELNNLLYLPKKNVIKLIHFFSLQELARKLHGLKSEELNNAVFEALPEEQTSYVKSCLENEEIPVLGNLELERWDGDKKKLAMMLQAVGMERFAKALSGQSHSFFNFLCLRLDTGRAAFLKRHFSTSKIEGLSDSLIQQLIVLMYHLESGKVVGTH